MPSPPWTYSDVALEHKNARGLTDFDLLGYLPAMLDTDNPASAQEQFDAGYRSGGGWRNFIGHEVLHADSEWPRLKYPGDPALRPIAKTQLRDERVYLYESSWVAIIQPNGCATVARMD